MQLPFEMARPTADMAGEKLYILLQQFGCLKTMPCTKFELEFALG